MIDIPPSWARVLERSSSLTDQEWARCLADRDRERITEANLRLVVLVAVPYQKCLPHDELIAAGNLGLVEGVNRLWRLYDPKRCHPATFLRQWIRRAITEEIERNRRVRVSKHALKWLKQLRGTDPEKDWRERAADAGLRTEGQLMCALSAAEVAKIESLPNQHAVENG